MSEALIIAVLNAVGPVGIETVISIMKGMKRASNIDDAIVALEATVALKASDFEKSKQV